MQYRAVFGSISQTLTVSGSVRQCQEVLSSKWHYRPVSGSIGQYHAVSVSIRLHLAVLSIIRQFFLSEWYLLNTKHERQYLLSPPKAPPLAVSHQKQPCCLSVWCFMFFDTAISCWLLSPRFCVSNRESQKFYYHKLIYSTHKLIYSNSQAHILYMSLRDYQAVSGSNGQYIAVYGSIWQYLIGSVSIQQYQKVSGCFWQYPLVSSNIRQYPAVFGIIRHYPAESGCIRPYSAVSGSFGKYQAVSGSFGPYQSSSSSFE